MAKEANYSATMLSEAASGRKQPTLEVTLAYVRACGGDVAEWTDRWHTLNDEQRAANPAPARDDAATTDTTEDARSRRSPAVLTAAVATVLAAVALVVVFGGQPEDSAQAREQRTVMPEDVAKDDTPVPDGTTTDAVPPDGLPCSTHANALACVDLRQHVVWVKDMPPADSHHAAIYWTTTTGSVQGHCHNYERAEGPWVTCPVSRPAGERETLGFRSAVVEEEVVLEWGPYVTVPIGG